MSKNASFILGNLGRFFFFYFESSFLNWLFSSYWIKSFTTSFLIQKLVHFKKKLIILAIVLLPFLPESSVQLANLNTQNFNVSSLNERAYGVVIASPFNILIGLLTLVCIYELVKGNIKVRLGIADITILLFYLYCLITLFFNFDFSAGLVWQLKLTLVVIVYFVFSHLEFNRKTIEAVLLGFTLAVAIQVALAGFQIVSNSQNIPFLTNTARINTSRIIFKTDQYSFNRVTGTFTHPNNLVVFLSLCLPLVFTYSILSKKKIIPAIIIASAIVVGFFTFSRWGMMTLGVALTLTLFIFMKAKLLTQFFMRLGKRVILRICIIAIIILVTLIGSNLGISKRFLNFSFNDASLNARFNYFEQAFYTLQLHPLGIGSGNSLSYLSRYDYTSTEVSTRYLVEPHSHLLLVITETGIPGVILYITFLGGLFYISLKNKSSSPVYTIFKLSLLTSFLIFIFNGLWEPRPIGDRVYTAMAIIMGILVNISLSSPKNNLPISKIS